MVRPDPVYISWEDYLARTSRSERMKRCYAASKRANRVHRCQWQRKLNPTGQADRYLREAITGPCVCCGSLPEGVCLGTNTITSGNVWSVIEVAKGRCMYCKSLAVEGRPSHPISGGPLPWEHIGRRIGSLEHIHPFLDGRINHLSNLGWACLWCNVHPEARILGASDHGGHHPD